MDGESTIAKLEKISGRSSSKQLQWVSECQAYSEDQICTVNCLTLIQGRIMDIMWI